MKLLNRLNINFSIYFILILFYMSLFVYFADPSLCEGSETIYSLKANLITETHKHRLYIINYEMFMDTYNLMVGRPTIERDFNAELHFLQATRRTTNDIRDSYSTINHIVTRIKVLEPTFQSPIQGINLLRVTR